MARLLLGLALVVGIVLIPLGLPGLWLMVGAALVYSIVAPGLGTGTLIGIALLALGSELLDVVLAGRFARRYGGSRRAAWGAVLGGLVGAVMLGLPVPLIGSVLGAVVGAFGGAFVGEISHRGEVHTASRAATGAVLGRVAAMAVKVGVGFLVAIWVIFALWL